MVARGYVAEDQTNTRMENQSGLPLKLPTVPVGPLFNSVSAGT